MRIDIHGHGASSVIERPISLDEMAADYFDLVQQLGIEQAIWGGVSLGGMTSLRITIGHPAAVLGLLLLATDALRIVLPKKYLALMDSTLHSHCGFCGTLNFSNNKC